MATPTFKNSVSEAPKEQVQAPNSSAKVERQKDDREIKETVGAGQQAYLEAIGLDESAETMGRVSEVLAEASEQSGDGSMTGGAKTTTTAQDPAAIKANLLKNLPSETMMRQQIEKEIKKEIGYLHKRAMKMLKSPGKINYFEMNNILKKIRDLKGLLFALVKASMEGLKTLWLRFVHGIM